MVTLISEGSSMMIGVYSYISFFFFYDSFLGGILINDANDLPILH